MNKTDWSRKHLGTGRQPPNDKSSVDGEVVGVGLTEDRGSNGKEGSSSYCLGRSGREVKERH